MGHVFTDKVDVTKLKEGMRAEVESHLTTYHGHMQFITDEIDDAWVLKAYGADNILYYVCEEDGTFCGGVKAVHLLDADPAEKMQAEHAEMLALLEEIYRLPYSLEEMRVMVQKFLLNRKAKQ